jgi:hypothetical protein
MAALNEQLKSVARMVEEMGESLKNSIAELKNEGNANYEAMRQEMADLRKKQEEQAANQAILLSDRRARDARLKKMKGLGSAAFLAVLGGVATKWGEAIYNWLAGHRGH